MKRRGFMQTLATLMPISTVHWSAGDQRLKRKHGLLTLEGHRAHKRATGETLHVFVNGEDVTTAAYEANDIEGYALVYCRDPEHHRDYTARGFKHLGTSGGACRMHLTGDVVIVPGPDL